MSQATVNRVEFAEFNIPDLDIPDMAIEEEIPDVYLSEPEKIKKFLKDIGITGIRGVEGSGKSLLMTRFAMQFHRLGGRVLSFPGYELKENGKVISENLPIEAWAKLDPNTLKNLLVCIDEIEDFFDAQMWQTVMVKIFTGVFGQRRKLNTGIIYTLQFWEELPKLMRRKTHFVIECKDGAIYNQYRDRQAPEGTITLTQIMDNFGKKNKLIPGYIYKGPTYHNKEYWSNYATDKNPDIMEKFTQIKVKRKVIEIDMNGDGVIDEKERGESKSLLDRARNGADYMPDRMSAGEWWERLQLNRNIPGHQTISAQVAKEYGYRKNATGLYVRTKRADSVPSLSPSVSSI